MKKNIIFVCLSVLLSFFIFGSSKNNGKTSVVGHVGMYGSEPFTYPCIITENEEIYAIKAKKDVLRELSKQQGKMLSFTGTIIENKENTISINSAKNGSFELDSWKVIRN